MVTKIKEPSREVAVFGGGCFWCTEAVFQMLKGVLSVQPGYTGGIVPNPTYDQVCNGQTGHAEVIKVEFDPRVIRYIDLLQVFFESHNPTTLNKQGNDVGSQYRSVIFYTNELQKKTAQEVVAQLSPLYQTTPIVTEVVSLEDFYPAEKYHMDYYQSNTEAPYCKMVIAPKVEKITKHFTQFIHSKTI